MQKYTQNEKADINRRISELGKVVRKEKWSDERYINAILTEIIESKVLELNTKIYLYRNGVNNQDFWEDCFQHAMASFFLANSNREKIIPLWERNPKELISFMCRIILWQSFSKNNQSFLEKVIKKTPQEYTEDMSELGYIPPKEFEITDFMIDLENNQ